MSDRLLLDANVLIWTISASNRISSRAKRALSRPASTLLVSVVSVWERLRNIFRLWPIYRSYIRIHSIDC